MMSCIYTSCLLLIIIYFVVLIAHKFSNKERRPFQASFQRIQDKTRTVTKLALDDNEEEEKKSIFHLKMFDTHLTLK